MTWQCVALLLSDDCHAAREYHAIICTAETSLMYQYAAIAIVWLATSILCYPMPLFRPTTYTPSDSCCEKKPPFYAVDDGTRRVSCCVLFPRHPTLFPGGYFSRDDFGGVAMLLLENEGEGKKVARG